MAPLPSLTDLLTLMATGGNVPQGETPPPKRGQPPPRAFAWTVVSMAVVVALYGLLFGFPFALGFVLMIWIHEMGHVLMLGLLGYPVSLPVFVPFVGALINMQEPPKDAQTEALVAYGGPLVGSVGAYLVYLAGLRTGNELLLQVAFIGFLVNLFNLIPVSPLDGGRIATAISRWLWVPGLLLLVWLFFVMWNPLILLIIGLGLYRAIHSLFSPPTELAEQGYFEIRPGIRMVVSLAYFGLILVIGRLTVLSYQTLQP